MGTGVAGCGYGVYTFKYKQSSETLVSSVYALLRCMHELEYHVVFSTPDQSCAATQVKTAVYMSIQWKETRGGCAIFRGAACERDAEKNKPWAKQAAASAAGPQAVMRRGHPRMIVTLCRRNLGWCQSLAANRGHKKQWLGTSQHQVAQHGKNRLQNRRHPSYQSFCMCS